MSSQPPAQSLALVKCVGIIVLKAETTAFVPCRVSAKGSVNSAAVYYFCRWQGPEVSALQRLQPKAKVNSRENPVRLAPGHAKLATRSCSQETCKENCKKKENWPGFWLLAVPRGKLLLQGELTPVQTPSVRGTHLSSSWRTSLEGEDSPGPSFLPLCLPAFSSPCSPQTSTGPKK